MKLQEITSQSRRDFWGTYECEFCGHLEHEVSGYDDNYYHTTVTPKKQCKKCGESTLSRGRDAQQVQTKYPEGFQV